MGLLEHNGWGQDLTNEWFAEWITAEFGQIRHFWRDPYFALISDTHIDIHDARRAQGGVYYPIMQLAKAGYAWKLSVYSQGIEAVSFAGTDELYVGTFESFLRWSDDLMAQELDVMRGYPLD